MIKAVIFDMYETLITLYESPAYFGTQMAIDAGIPEDSFQSLWRPTEADRTTGRATLEDVLKMILIRNNCYTKELLDSIVSKRIRSKELCFDHLHPEIISMMSGLRDRGIKIGLISNCFSEETKVIRNSVLYPYFDYACLSYEQGLQKPDPEIFKKCMKELNVDPLECLYVGDGGSHELEASSALGMTAVQAVWYLKEGTKQPTGRKEGFIHIESPNDVLNYVKTIS